MGRPGTYCHQRRNAEMELVWSTLFVGSVRLAVRQKNVSNCVGVCMHERMPQSVREKKAAAGAQSWITWPRFMALKRTQSIGGQIPGNLYHALHNQEAVAF